MKSGWFGLGDACRFGSIKLGVCIEQHIELNVNTS